MRVRTFRSADAMHAAQIARLRRYKTAIMLGDMAMHDAMLRVSDKLLSGRKSPSQLAREGHPYSIKHQGIGPLLPINKREGTLLASRRLRAVYAATANGGGAGWSLSFDAPYAPSILGGSDRLKDPGFWPVLRQRLDLVDMATRRKARAALGFP